MGNSNSLDKIVYFIKDLIVHGCQLTYKEFASIMGDAYVMSTIFEKSNTYNLSDNTFTDKDPHQWERLKHFLAGIKGIENKFDSKYSI